MEKNSFLVSSLWGTGWRDGGQGCNEAREYSVFGNYHEYLWACCMEIPENECLALASKLGRESERAKDKRIRKKIMNAPCPRMCSFGRMTGSRLWKSG